MTSSSNHQPATVFAPLVAQAFLFFLKGLCTELLPSVSIKQSQSAGNQTPYRFSGLRRAQNSSLQRASCSLFSARCSPFSAGLRIPSTRPCA